LNLSGALKLAWALLLEYDCNEMPYRSDESEIAAEDDVCHGTNDQSVCEEASRFLSTYSE
jgi:hypothetical protein